MLLFNSQLLLGWLRYQVTASDIPNQTAPTAADPPSAEPRLIIPKIQVNAPVVYDEPSTQEFRVQRALERGVVHYGSTPVPGQSGNAVFVGHSSNTYWARGGYKFVFALLNKLTPEDEIIMDYQSKRYHYKVNEVKEVKPTDFSVLNPHNQPTISLITCVPPGTSWRRLVVTATQVEPDPKLAAAPSTQAVTKPAQPNLPGNTPSIFDSLKRLLGID